MPRPRKHASKDAPNPESYQRRREQIRAAQTRHRRRATELREQLEKWRSTMQSRLIMDGSAQSDIRGQNELMWEILTESIMADGWDRVNISSLPPDQREYLLQRVNHRSQETGYYPPSPNFDASYHQPSTSSALSLESLLYSFHPQQNQGQDDQFQLLQPNSSYQMPLIHSDHELANDLLPSMGHAEMGAAYHSSGVVGAAGRLCYHTSRGMSGCPLANLGHEQLASAHRFVELLRGMCSRGASFHPSMALSSYGGPSSYQDHYGSLSSMDYRHHSMSAVTGEIDLCNEHSVDDTANTNPDTLTPVQALFFLLRRAHPNYYLVSAANLDSLGAICSRLVSCVPGSGAVVSRLDFDNAINSLL
ncbi:hypothetical protein Cpir12675_005435 [Ceratocystis pirilliformis]|uniref:BZIP domain-containing protein n=1 Tax=Ceratocystis pirilliformis TaxID=259994 RepID=A0ABR3YSP6_9PEZI